jgi:hypothetical protein
MLAVSLAACFRCAVSPYRLFIDAYDIVAARSFALAPCFPTSPCPHPLGRTQATAPGAAMTNGGPPRGATRRSAWQTGQWPCPWPCPWPPAGGAGGSGLSTTALSVVSTIRAIDAALTTAERVTLTGSTTPSLRRSP